MFTEQKNEYLVLDLKPRVESGFRADKVAFWNDVVPKVLEFTQTEKKETETAESTAKDEL